MGRAACHIRRIERALLFEQSAPEGTASLARRSLAVPRQRGAAGECFEAVGALPQRQMTSRSAGIWMWPMSPAQPCAPRWISPRIPAPDHIANLLPPAGARVLIASQFADWSELAG